VLQPSDHFCSPPLDPLQQFHVLLVLRTQITFYLYIRGLGEDTVTFKPVFYQLAEGQDEAILSGLDRSQDHEGGLLHVESLPCARHLEHLVARKCATDLRKAVLQLRVLFWLS